VLLSLSSREDDIVDWNEYKLNEVANETHYYKTHCTSLQNLEVLLSVWLLALSEEVL